MGNYPELGYAEINLTLPIEDIMLIKNALFEYSHNMYSRSKDETLEITQRFRCYREAEAADMVWEQIKKGQGWN